MILGAIISAIVVGIITGVLNWWLKIPSLVLTMGLAMVFEIIGSKLAGHYGFVQIDNKYAIFGSFSKYCYYLPAISCFVLLCI